MRINNGSIIHLRWKTEDVFQNMMPILTSHNDQADLPHLESNALDSNRACRVYINENGYTMDFICMHSCIYIYIYIHIVEHTAATCCEPCLAVG
jgi:hypothetical protein